MLFDLHNLAPSIGQVNQLRLNDRYADLPNSISSFGKCKIEDTRGLFEPPDCHKGDAARVWFYMANRYGVVKRLSVKRCTVDFRTRRLHFYHSARHS